MPAMNRSILEWRRERATAPASHRRQLASGVPVPSGTRAAARAAVVSRLTVKRRA